ncbi:hypothetical protein A2154_01830 [Candidatus Gottesmanbacteria bacterium RBG_16_43_7]|uniref:Uncharacterized protein n=1 Tax=Candidatus Gottesmanbacteria bacterium RBG_16_43_7 TaxID=1798373 RepID=A0A1F5ZBP5_9BACT|nr:MAG: hypothetical protein A2154_01830 [Candidatus Gottesmanbacteria bacterium RBG_16_43_7]
MNREYEIVEKERIFFHPPPIDGLSAPDNLLFSVTVYEFHQTERIARHTEVGPQGLFSTQVVFVIPEGENFDTAPVGKGTHIIHAVNKMEMDAYLRHRQWLADQGVEIPYQDARLSYTDSPVVGRG